MSIPNEYSIECGDCKSFNISPVKCENCWRKIIQAETQKKIKELKLEIKNTIMQKNFVRYSGFGERMIFYFNQDIDKVFNPKSEVKK